ncbi:spore germination protein, partial [Pseudomonas sp. 2822-17]|uniref:spore germination protein n=1 Tax=Pseudomonas sp. 2822-17 TaxID=1712678 RepID=UPI001C444029
QMEKTTSNNQNTRSTTQSKQRVTLSNLKEQLINIDDLKIKQIDINGEKADVIYIDTLVQSGVFQDLIFTPLNQVSELKGPEDVLKSS